MCSWDFYCGTPRRCRLGCAACVLLSLVISLPLILVLLAPLVVEHFFNAAQLTVLNLTLAEPNAFRLYVEVYAELNNAGPIPVFHHTNNIP